MRTLAVIILALCLPGAAPAGEIFDRETVEFLRGIDARNLRALGVQYNGRVAPMDTVAREQLSQMAGRSRIDGIPPVVAYLELYFNSGRYLAAPIVYVRAKNMRKFIVRRLTGEARDAFERTGRIPPACLLNELAVRELAAAGRADMKQFMRAGDLPSLGPALAGLAQQRQYKLLVDRLYARYSAFLALEILRLVPTPRGDWPPAELLLRAQAADRPEDHLPAGTWAPARRLAALRDAWRARDPRAVNSIAGELARELPRRAPGYPSLTTRRLELLYNRTYSATPLWIGFAGSLVLLIIAAASRRRWARRAGMAVFCASTGLLAVGFAVRWVISGRQWYLPPMMNQWEAVTSSALLGAAVAVVLELIWKRNYLALAAALYATVALLCGHFIPIFFPGRMDPHLGALPGLLASKLMAVHVSVIIIGHAFVGMTFFISVTYLLAAIWRPARAGPRSAPPNLAGPFPEGTLAAIDRCNLIAAQLACWTVALGTVLGAWWGDVAWARWWGWDRKETWALLTAIVYIVALHVRFVVPARSRGLVTAAICILGCAVMLFNWIIVNFFLAGMHSYA